MYRCIWVASKHKTMKKRHLKIVLSEDLPFKELVPKIEGAFGIPLPYENKKGRLIAEGGMKDYKVSLVDRIDDLSAELCDENHVLEIIVDQEPAIDMEKIEQDVKARLLKENVLWQSGIWSRIAANEPYRRIYPA
jgi:hypothetical protein